MTPESYLGADKAERFTNGELAARTTDFGEQSGSLPVSHLRYRGRWAISGEAATAVSHSELDLRFRARRVFLVLGSPSRPRPVRILLDGRPLPRPLAGADASGGAVTVSFQRLYRLVNLPRVETHTLSLRFDGGVSGYAFTFG